MHGFTLACNLCPSAEIVALHTCLRLTVYLHDYASYMYLYHFHMYVHLLLCYFLIIISIRSSKRCTFIFLMMYNFGHILKLYKLCHMHTLFI
jgi:hypothetical protein